jgi:hypothetical protein
MYTRRRVDHMPTTGTAMTTAMVMRTTMQTLNPAAGRLS